MSTIVPLLSMNRWRLGTRWTPAKQQRRWRIVRFSLPYRATSSDSDGGQYPSSLYEQKFYSTSQQINRRDFTQRDLL